MNSKNISCCPLCKSKDSKFHSFSLPNLYSEKLASILKAPEKKIIEEHGNFECLSCGLIYKKNWFTTKSIDTLFKKYVPIHPKGWDIVSGRFSAKNFYNEVELYKIALEHDDLENINRYKRALSSIVDSIDGFSATYDGEKILKAIKNEKPELLLKYKDLMEKSIKEPSAFKRFSGFSSLHLWNYIDQKCGGIRDYSELGCPLWGLMPQAKKSGLSTIFYRRDEINYWSESCKKDGQHCSIFMHRTYGIPIKDWKDKPRDNRHVLGLFQYLDHLENPMQFLEEVFESFDVAAVILDSVENPLAIQHFTGFTQKSLAYIAHEFNKTLNTDFEAIKTSGNVLFLFMPN